MCHEGTELGRRGSGLNAAFRVAKKIAREIDKAEKARVREQNRRIREAEREKREIVREEKRREREEAKRAREAWKAYQADAKAAYESRCKKREQLRKVFLREDLR